MTESKKWDDYIRPYDESPLNTGDFVIFRDPEEDEWLIDRGVWDGWGCGDLHNVDRPSISDDTDISYWDVISWGAKTLEDAVALAQDIFDEDPDFGIDNDGLFHPGGTRIFLCVGQDPNYYTLRFFGTLTEPLFKKSRAEFEQAEDDVAQQK